MNSTGEYESISAADFQAKYGKKKNLRKKSNQQINAEMTESFLRQCKEAGLPMPKCEHQFHPKRKWKIDFYFQTHFTSIMVEPKRIAVEVEGFGHHHLGTFTKNMDKYNELSFAGIYLLRFTVKQVKDGTAIREIQRIL